MIYYFTGLPGASKTLNAIKFVCEDPRLTHLPDPDDKKKKIKRPVYYYDINGLNIEEWTELTEEEVNLWYERPAGSVIVIDECQNLWPTRPTGSPVPESIRRMAKNRHLGIDLVIISQDPKQIDTAIRMLVNFHTHIERIAGSKLCSFYTYDNCEVNPTHRRAVERADIKKQPIDKNYFDKYKSAEIHTVKFKMPRYFKYLIFFIIFVIIGTWYFFNRLSTQGLAPSIYSQDEQSEESTALTGSQRSLNYQRESKHITTDEYIQLHKPRITNLPRSAPIFDEITTAVVFPIENCLLNVKTDNCQCYSQQATKMDVDYDTCIHYIYNGYPFDYTRKPPKEIKKIREGARGGATRAHPSALALDHEQEHEQVRIVANSGAPTYPTLENSYKGITLE